uniref:Uncharacterized protein n=1 Tax=Moniliophthora roreri TaxID=221103 RepID=A0A0W0ETX0_MONRR
MAYNYGSATYQRPSLGPGAQQLSYPAYGYYGQQYQQQQEYLIPGPEMYGTHLQQQVQPAFEIIPTKEHHAGHPATRPITFTVGGRPPRISELFSGRSTVDYPDNQVLVEMGVKGTRINVVVDVCVLASFPRLV